MLFFLAILLTASEPVVQSRDQSTLPQSALLEAMHTALAPIEAEIEILETSHYPAPAGEIEFSIKDLQPPASPRGTTRWRGFIRHDGDRRFAIWAIVRITARFQRVVAVTTLRSGTPIRAEQLREETYSGFPLGTSLTLNDVVGRELLRTVHEGAAINAGLLTQPVVIAKGSHATAEYTDGSVRLKVVVIAEQAGRVGEWIDVRNPSSQKVFAARVRGEGQLVVDENQRSKP